MNELLPLSYDLLQKMATADLVRPDQLLGAHVTSEGGVEGVRFAVWAPNAQHVSVVGDFNAWNGLEHPMNRLDFGFWGLFVPQARFGQAYKYNVTGQDGRTVQKADPYMQFAELRPSTASIIWQSSHAWNDAEWMAGRDQSEKKPISIYEVHLGSWARGLGNWYMNYRDIAHRLADYVDWLGYTHVELMGVMEHPFDGSWGYQVTGYYAPTSRFGTPDDFKYLVDHLHSRGIAVLLDWVPGHFPTDEHGLARFDGGPLFEYADPRKGFHHDWNTYIFDYGRNEVVMFLIGSALKWLEEYHIDGLRVDAVASILYLDFSRTDWIPNIYGGNENLEAIAFLKRLNDVVAHQAPGTIMIAEESTNFPGVTSPAPFGLGFHYKWAMGWMNDSLSYIQEDPIYRKYDHHKLTFFNVYRTSEKFVLALSHDEVVHGKRSLLRKMPGDQYAQMAGLRVFYTYLWTTPGKKLLFMGQEFAQSTEWNENIELPWHLTDLRDHRGVMLLVRDLNRLYREFPALHVGDHSPEGMLWVNADDAEASTYSYIRRDPDSSDWVLVVLNMTPVYREGYPVGVPMPGLYQVLLSTDDGGYGGFGTQQSSLEAFEGGDHGQTHRLLLNLAPNSALILRPLPSEPQLSESQTSESQLTEQSSQESAPAAGAELIQTTAQTPQPAPPQTVVKPKSKAPAKSKASADSKAPRKTKATSKA
ncbi:1,4-alpha-glucan branching protein GlgB [Deinococcus psychrotolerans]|uniref:1,4-alpha-glucan branching enzyme GlgB n=1 Tax=Deinococcus psychrotolerans TaxID=2489213 RepID=A0A3G8YB36_9DEIO|nr:1,4-alpha-glucan branching protein GlgB [Deinococcus psychrotolerans]AZI42518.1 1,4-alpha-glucan branching protein GlgB [Deinococcus psychrotolerans]